MGEEAHHIGELIAGRFLLERHLGAGGFGCVWLVKDAADRVLALKLLHAQHANNEIILARFAREARILERFDHPNLAKAYAWSARPPQPFLAMELVAGRPLDELMTERCLDNTPLGLDEIGSIFGGMLQATAYAHALGVVHRDLKPRNVLIAKPLRVRVLDFGLAKLLEPDEGGATTIGRVLGTPSYFAPEQVEGSAVDERTDVFALGIILFELLTLRRAWMLDTEGRPVSLRDVPLHRVARNAAPEIMRRIRTGACPKPSAWRADRCSMLDGVVAKATAIEAGRRYADVASFLADFERAVGSDRTAEGLGMITADESVEPSTMPTAHELSASDSTPVVIAALRPLSVDRAPLPFEIGQKRQSPDGAPARASAALFDPRTRSRARAVVAAALFVPIAAASALLALVQSSPPQPLPASEAAYVSGGAVPEVKAIQVRPELEQPRLFTDQIPVVAPGSPPPRRSPRSKTAAALPASEAPRADASPVARLKPRASGPVEDDSTGDDAFRALRTSMSALEAAPRDFARRTALANQIDAEAKRLPANQLESIRRCIENALSYADPADAAATLGSCLRQLEMARHP